MLMFQFQNTQAWLDLNIKGRKNSSLTWREFLHPKKLLEIIKKKLERNSFVEQYLESFLLVHICLRQLKIRNAKKKHYLTLELFSRQRYKERKYSKLSLNKFEVKTLNNSSLTWAWYFFNKSVTTWSWGFNFKLLKLDSIWISKVEKT